MRPVPEAYQVTQGFGEGATAGVAPDPEGKTALGYLVWLYGDYQHDGHAGTDIGTPVGTPVRAARSGTVVWCDWDVNLPGGVNGWSVRWFFYQRFGGRILVIQHAPGDLDVYAHLSAFKVGYGQFVQEGDLVALSGDSSAGEDGQLGPHLHTERIVDLSYPTGGGMIYGRIDPRTVWGGIAAQGSAVTEEDDMEPGTIFISKDGAKVTLQTLLNSIDTKVDGVPLFDQNVRATFDVLRAQNAALLGAITALAESKGNVSTEEITAAVERAVADFTSTWHLSITQDAPAGVK